VNRFVDEAVIDVASGHGGAGSVHFRREKYVPRGGPDGGDGGDGGDVIFEVQRNLKTLSHLSMRRVFHAEDGRPGAGRRKHGRNGGSVHIPVPPGTLVKDADSGELLKDFAGQEDSWTLFTGGKGGRGNWHFSTPSRQAPRYAQPGRPGKQRLLRLELNIIADIGLVGLPNAGKSTLLSVLTNAHPRIASYPFTTKIPNIGVMRYYDQDILLADIPGIIAGASGGAGLGLRFLKHINRTRALAFLIDLGEPACLETFATLTTELGSFSAELLRKPRVILGTKLDLEGADTRLRVLRAGLRGEQVVGISAPLHQGIGEVQHLFARLAAAEA
jgi:GTP-binding protein